MTDAPNPYDEAARQLLVGLRDTIAPFTAYSDEQLRLAQFTGEPVSAPVARLILRFRALLKEHGPEFGAAP